MSSTEQRLYFDKLACDWDQIQDQDNQEKIKRIFSSKISAIDSPVLDIGCGTGVLLPMLRELNESYVIEMDISKKMLDLAHKKHGNTQKSSYIQADAHNIPFPEGQFGSVICFCVYPHFHLPEIAIREFCRILRPGGKLVILHLMNHIELNILHAEKNGVIAEDILPASGVLGTNLVSFGFHIERCEEEPGLYLIIAKKNN